MSAVAAKPNLITIDQTSAEDAGNPVVAQRLKVQIVLCKNSFLYFLEHYGAVLIPPTPTNPGGLQHFQMWPHLRELALSLITDQRIVVFKSRQIGVSWVIANYVNWAMNFRDGSLIMLFSRGELEAMELLNKCRICYNATPWWMRADQDGKGSATEMKLVNGSIMRALPATESAGVSFTASMIVCDEWDFHPYAEQNWFAAKPTLEGGGQFIGASTKDGWKWDTLALQMFRDALDGKNKFKPFFFPWTVRPNRDETWYKDTMEDTPSRELKGLTREMFMKFNYPEKISDITTKPQTMCAFDVAILDEMAAQCRAPVPKIGLDNKIAHVWQDYAVGSLYDVAMDTSHGVGKDYSVTAILNCRTGAVVADVFGNNISVDEFAYQSYKLLEFYKFPELWPEDNDWGRAVIHKLMEMGYPHFGYQDKARSKVGFHTGEATRLEMWSELISAVASRQLTIFSKEGLGQFYDVIRNVEKEGRIEAQDGGHDDYPMAVGIAWLKRVKVLNMSRPVRTQYG